MKLLDDLRLVRFDKETERVFKADYQEHSVLFLRVGIVIIFSVTSTFFLLDKWVAPITANYIGQIRLFIMFPVLIITFLLTFTKLIHKYFQVIVTTADILLCMGVLFMLIVSEDSELAHSTYLIGIIQLLICTVALRLLFFQTVITVLTVMIVYMITAFVHPELTRNYNSYDFFTVFINNLYSLAGAGIAIIGTSYVYENIKRKSFRYQKKLKELNEQKDKFFSILAHDLRTPFSGFVGISDIMSKEIDTMSINEIKDLSKTLNSASTATLKLLEDLLEWSRVQTNRIQYNPETVNLEQLIKKSVDVMTSTASGKGLNIRIQVNPDTDVLCDTNMIYNVLRNLISNSIKFTNNGGTITIKAKDNGTFTQVSVSDNGVGIQEKDIKDLFRIDKSFTTPGTNNEKGTGLGLILCKEFVEKNKGEIWVESSPGKGSTFNFSIPLNNFQQTEIII